jgi:hypothetical protein
MVKATAKTNRFVSCIAPLFVAIIRYHATPHVKKSETTPVRPAFAFRAGVVLIKQSVLTEQAG